MTQTDFQTPAEQMCLLSQLKPCSPNVTVRLGIVCQIEFANDKLISNFNLILHAIHTLDSIVSKLYVKKC